MSFAHGLADHMQRLVYTDQELIVSLTNSLKLREHEIRQHQETLWGRILSLIMPINDPDKIEIDGMRLQQLFDLTDQAPPEEISIRAAYKIDLSEFRRLLATAGERVHLGANEPGTSEPE